MDKVHGLKYSFLGDRKWLTVLFLALITLAIAILTWHLPFIGDDYIYNYVIENGADSDRQINNIYDLFVSQYNHLLTVNGRFIVHFVLQFIIAFFGKWFFNLLNPLFFLAYILLTAYYALGKVNFPAVVATVALVLFMPTFADLYLWMAGSMNYLWTTVVVLIFLIQLDRREDRLIGWSSWKILLLSFVAGCSHEGISVPIAVGLLAVALPSYRKIRHTERFWMLVMFAVGAFICAVFIVHRAAPTYDEPHMIFYDRIYKGATILGHLHMIYLLIALAVIGLFINKTKVLSVLRLNISWIIAIIITVPIIYVSGVWYDRTAYMIEFASMLLILRLFYEFKDYFSSRHPSLHLSKTSPLFIGAMVLGIMIIIFLSCTLYWSKQNRLQYLAMEDQILAGNQVICYDNIEVPKIFHHYIMDGTPKEIHALSPDYQYCATLAKYYHVKSLAFYPRQFWNDIADSSKSYDEFTDFGHLPFYVKQKKDKGLIEKIWYVLRPATEEEKPWWVRLTGIQREEEGVISYDAVFDVVLIDDEEWLFVQKYKDLDPRLDYIEITYKGDKIEP